MKAKIQSKLERGCLNFPSLWGMPGIVLPRIIAAIRTIILSLSNHWWQMTCKPTALFKYVPGENSILLPELSWGLSPSSGRWLFSAFPAQSSALRILSSPFTLCRINCRSCWNEREKELWNEHHRLPPPQRRWASGEEKHPWREIFQSSGLEGC